MDDFFKVYSLLFKSISDLGKGGGEIVKDINVWAKTPISDTTVYTSTDGNYNYIRSMDRYIEITKYIKGTDIIIPRILNQLEVQKIRWNVFKNATAITSITLGEALRNLGSEVFYGTSITEIIIPNSVTAIGIRAFSQIKNY